jgi:hypothetical protein
MSWRGAAPDVTGEVVLQEKALARIAVPKVPLIKVRACCRGFLRLSWHIPPRLL